MAAPACDYEKMPSHPSAKKVSAHGGGKKKSKGRKARRKRATK
jgi:hypothetical protein